MATLYRIFAIHPDSGFYDFLEDSYFVSPFNIYKYLCHLQDTNITGDVDYHIDMFQIELDKDRVTMVQIAGVRELAQCTLKEAEQALYARHGSVYLAVEMLRNAELAEMLSEDEAYPAWTKFKVWLGKFKNKEIEMNPFTPPQEKIKFTEVVEREASWEDL